MPLYQADCPHNTRVDEEAVQVPCCLRRRRGTSCGRLDFGTDSRQRTGPEFKKWVCSQSEKTCTNADQRFFLKMAAFPPSLPRFFPLPFTNRLFIIETVQLLFNPLNSTVVPTFRISQFYGNVVFFSFGRVEVIAEDASTFREDRRRSLPHFVLAHCAADEPLEHLTYWLVFHFF